jgi:non-specific serine/threonine protein kinase
VQLFVARARALDPSLSLQPENLAAIALVCRRLDGFSLAIELAAARATTLGLEKVASRLNDPFGLLTGGRRTALPRHRILRATLVCSEWAMPSVLEGISTLASKSLIKAELCFVVAMDEARAQGALF